MSTASDTAVVERAAEKKAKVRHVYNFPYTHALCGRRRDQPMEDLHLSPQPGVEYCVVCWHMHFGEFPA